MTQVVDWDHVKGFADDLFSVWVDDRDYAWSERAWPVLAEAGLTQAKDDQELAQVFVRLMALAAIYHTFSYRMTECGGFDLDGWIEGLRAWKPRLIPDDETASEIGNRVYGEAKMEVYRALLGPDRDHFKLLCFLLSGISPIGQLDASEVESRAYAGFDDQDPTLFETFDWLVVGVPELL